MGVTAFVSEIKRVENYHDWKLSHVIQHGLQGFTVKDIESESMFSQFCNFGFRKKHSTETAAFRNWNIPLKLQLLEHMDKQRLTGAAFISDSTMVFEGAVLPA